MRTVDAIIQALIGMLAIWALGLGALLLGFVTILMVMALNHLLRHGL